MPDNPPRLVGVSMIAITFTTAPVEHDGSPAESAPVEVDNTSATAASTGASLAWNNPADNDVDYIEITWSPEDGESQPKEVSADADSTTINGPSRETDYTFTIKTVDSAGKTSCAASITATTLQKEQWRFETDDLEEVESSPATCSAGILSIHVACGEKPHARLIPGSVGYENPSIPAARVFQAAQTHG